MALLRPFDDRDVAGRWRENKSGDLPMRRKNVWALSLGTRFRPNRVFAGLVPPETVGDKRVTF
jgi:hypothetical protein